MKGDIKRNVLLGIGAAVVAIMILNGVYGGDENKPRGSATKNDSVPAAAKPAVEVKTTQLLLSEGVVFELDVDLTEPKRPVLVGKTNLPEGTEVMTSVQSEDQFFFGQDRATVRNGGFRAGPFGPPTGLTEGSYTASATMPLPRLQDARVRAIIGEEGENLHGPTVERGQMGVTVSTEKPFQVGTDQEARAQSGAMRSEAAAVLDELRQLGKKGRDMEALRNPADLSKLEKCGELMRQRQAEARALEDRADRLPYALKVMLGAAAIDIVLCVSCSGQATEHCDLAGESLRDAETILQQGHL